MSLQNLLKQNNYELFCGTMNVNDIVIDDIISADTIKTNNLQKLSGTDISILGNLVPAVGSSTAFQIGAPNLYFSNLWCQRLQGAGSEVIVQNGITGVDGTSELEVKNGIILYQNDPQTENQSVLTQYWYTSGTLTAEGAIPDQTINYSAVLVGNVVTITIQNFLGTCNNTSSPILMVGLPDEFMPSSDKIISGVPVDVNNTQNNGVIVVRSDSGNLDMYPSPRLNVFFSSTYEAGFYGPVLSPGVADTSYSFTFSYNLN